MFWGLIMEPGRCYTQTVKASFHVSMAALDIANANNEPAQVMCMFEGRNYLLCTLNKKNNVNQVPLDLNFVVGSKVSFATNGKSHVHLTGYLTQFDDVDDEEAEEEEEDEDAVFDDPPAKKRSKRLAALEPPAKKAKSDISSDALEEESDDSDFEIESELQKEDSVDEEESDDDEDVVEVEEDENAVAEEEEGEDDDEASSLSDEDDDENGVVIKPAEEKPKQNGTPKKVSAPKQKANTPDKTQQSKKPQKQQTPKKVVLKSGVVVSDLKEGTGPIVKNGKFVHVYYEGRLKDNNKVFDSSVKGPGFSFRVGKGEVIKGWDIGLVGMKVGGKRRIICPPGVAYGAKGSPPVIPPNSTLVFEVELKKIS